MRLRTLVRDCLYLNWALPVKALPELPEPLRYEMHDGDGGKVAFASALFFRQRGARLAALPLLRLSHPQFNLRLYVLDGEGTPSVFFRRMLVPPWVVPGGWLTQQPLRPGRFEYPAPASFVDGDVWRWRVERKGELAVRARRSSPMVGEGPRFASWEDGVRYFRQRPRGYSLGPAGLHRVDTTHPRVAVWPMSAEVEEAGLITRNLGWTGAWPAPHSAFLCPEIPFVFELSTIPAGVAELARAAAPVAADPVAFAGSPRSWRALEAA